MYAHNLGKVISDANRRSFTGAMISKNGLCERIGELRNIQAIFLVNDGSIVQWKTKKRVRMPLLSTWTTS